METSKLEAFAWAVVLLVLASVVGWAVWAYLAPAEPEGFVCAIPLFGAY